MSLRVFNSLTRKKEEFVPHREDRVGMYVCGVTVYDYCHVGHARSAAVFDTIFRYLKHLGYQVAYARNFTDIDDKIIKRAKEENLPWQEVTRKYIQAFYDDMGKLNIEMPTIEPKATDHIPEMITMISSLIDNKKAYEADGDVFYSVLSFTGYGQLSGKNTDDLLSGARVEVNESKRNPLDFALWKKSKPDEPAWESPWGPGRPGWHIECSAMGTRYLGETFDIHGGGKDLIFPHHENEIAQSCGASGKAPVKYWIHNGFVNIDKEKMSKSLGNFFTLRDIYKRHHPEVLRLFLISSHYRNPIDFSEKNIEDAEKVLIRFYQAIEAAEGVLVDKKITGLEKPGPLIKKFEEAMNDDFNTAVALAHMNEELRNLNRLLIEAKNNPDALKDLKTSVAALKQAGNVLGLLFRIPKEFQAEIFQLKNKELGLDTEKIEALIAARNSARQAKDWGKADQCRDDLTAMGVVIEDTPNGTEWKIK
ncbi:MAG: cysteine--tRNA ligase [Nitrospinaceae bacterium]|nr:MAG: cysteine--tRNA ligase [Nitrospinaceae bacterium]